MYFLSNFLNDPNSVGPDAPKSLVRILTKILKDRDNVNSILHAMYI